MRVAWLPLILLSTCLSGQTAASSGVGAPNADTGFTLHAYSNLVQIPVLVLDGKDRQPLALDSEQFKARIDSGPFFKPKQVRREGEDPIRLLMLFSVDKGTLAILKDLPEALAQMSPEALHAQDSVSSAVLKGCYLSKWKPLPPEEQSLRTTGEKLAKAAEVEHFDRVDGRPCNTAPRLLDSIGILVNSEFDQSRSRRVLLLVSSGEDADDRLNFKDVRSLAIDKAVTIFVVRLRSQNAPHRRESVSSGRQTFSYWASSTGEPDMLRALAELTGGVQIQEESHTLTELFDQVLRLVRDRYILEFVRPSKIAQGLHDIDVQTTAKHAFVRAGGVGLPLPDPQSENDVNRVPSDTSGEPPVGKRRVLR